MSDEIDNLEEIEAQNSYGANERKPARNGRITMKNWHPNRYSLRKRATNSTKQRRPPITLAPDGK